MITGVAILGGGTLLYRHGGLGGIAWQVSCGVGIYSAYLVMGTAFLDRLLAASRSEGTIVFLQFISDGSGWLGTVFILFWKSLSADKSMRVSDLFAQICLWASVFMGVLLILMNAYFMWVLPKGEVSAVYGSLAEASRNSRRTDGLEEAADDTLRLNGRGIAAAVARDASHDGKLDDSLPLLGTVA